MSSEQMHSNKPVSKSLETRLSDLEFHLWSLGRALTEMVDGDLDQSKNIAASLRLLAIRSHKNVPLLLDLANEFGKELPSKESKILIPFLSYRDDEDYTTDRISKFERYVTETSIGVWIDPGGRLTRRTTKDLILTIANKAGTAHEDREIPTWFIEKTNSLKGRYDSNLDKLFETGVFVFRCGTELLLKLHQENKFVFKRNWDTFDIKKMSQKPPKTDFVAAFEAIQQDKK